MATQARPWHDPLAMLTALSHQSYDSLVCLYSGLKTGYSGRYSYIAFGAQDVVAGDDWTLLNGCDGDTELPHHFGLITYDAPHEDANLPPLVPSYIDTPPMQFVRYAHVLRYDHDACELLYEGPDSAVLPEPIAASPPECLPAVRTLGSALNQNSYIAAVEEALAQIHAGNVYQVNVTRKYGGQLEAPVNLATAFAGFKRLCEASPAPYSAFIWHEGRAVLSSSPELFLKADAHGTLTTRPIKGTLAREDDAALLARSAKDRAENLMIVDLMRHDLATCARAGSVAVPALFDVDSFATLHHLSSTITAQLTHDATLLDALRATFPPGSMTGAPKLSAMRLIARMEAMQRGIYSGALGWVHGQACELSVVIRTIIIQGNRFEFQVGGGIVSDSVPEREYREIVTKARAICHVLDIAPQRLLCDDALL